MQMIRKRKSTVNTYIKIYRGSEEAQLSVRQLTALGEDRSSIPSTHVGPLTTNCKLSFGGSNTLFSSIDAHTSIDTHTHK